MMAVGRDEEARPLFEKVVAQLSGDVEVGVRHPNILMRLAEAYGWLGKKEQALSTLELAADYGASVPMALCCEDLGVPDPAWIVSGERASWDALADEPRFQRVRTQLRGAVEQQRFNIVSLLRMHDMEALLAPLMDPSLATR